MTKVRPFEGVKILQLCWAGVGVYTLNFLSHYGAKTIRVESATAPDPVRLFQPFAKTYKEGEPVGLERSAFYSITHTAPEYDLALNLRTPEGVEIFKKLVTWADVVGEGFPTGVMDKLGLDYEGLKKIKPDIIMMRTCGYGHTGPMATQPGFGSILTAVTMMDNLIGWPDRRPLAPTTYYTDMFTPVFAGLAIMVALDYRRRTGKGQYIDHAQIEAGLNYMTPLLLDYQANGRELSLTGNKCAYAAPHGIYRCQGEDRWVAIGVMSDEEWRSFGQAIGSPAWTKDPKYATAAGRVAASDELDRLVESWTQPMMPEEVQVRLQAAGVGAGVVASSKDIDADAQLNYYNFYREIDHPYMGKLRYYHPASIELSEAETAVAPPVMVGEHTDEICTQILGMSKEEIERLRQKNVFT